MQTTTSNPIRWNSSLSFIFATSAAAIGLGNIWRFPYLVGQNGGGAFVIIYLLCVLLLGIPLLVAEMVIGRIGRNNPATAFANVASYVNGSSRWSMVGLITILASFLILTYYTVISGWVLDYSARGILGQFKHMTELKSIGDFHELQHSHWEMLLTDTLINLGMLGVIILGVKRGLERTITIMFPALFILLLILLIFAAQTGYFHQALNFLFEPYFNKITPNICLQALGQAFFSLNIAMGVTIMFSAYLPEQTSLLRCAVAVAFADTLFALLAGLIIFPIVFAYHLKVAAGPSLIFITLPIALGQLPFGNIIGILFFIMLLLAAFTSAISLIEPAVEWVAEKFKWSRKVAASIVILACWLLSIAAVGSFSHPDFFSIAGYTYYQIVDNLTASIMLPVGGLLIAIFCGWRLTTTILNQELSWSTQTRWVSFWRNLLRYFAPLAILLILLSVLGVF